MQYRKDKYGHDLSILGYGCMRFSRKGAGIDIDKTEQEILEAFRAGVNYYDTAYIYPGSEAALGEILARNGIRDQVNIATKLPQYMVKSRASLDKFFDEELSRLRTDRVDYYLMHHLTDIAQWERLKGVGVLDWIREKKSAGAIRNIGFSYHGNTANFLKILQDYDWDFCQIQYNYLDDTSQAGVEGLRAAAARGIPVVIMEPLRGGRLANIPADLADRLKAREPQRSIASWAFRYVGSFPRVMCALSGMTYMEHLQDNLENFLDFEPLTDEEKQLLWDIADRMENYPLVPCTGCQYCMPCPYGINIPGIFKFYNDNVTAGTYVESKEQEGYAKARRKYLLAYNEAIPTVRQADHCIACRRCEKDCPQNIRIPDQLRRIDRYIESLKRETLE